MKRFLAILAATTVMMGAAGTASAVVSVPYSTYDFSGTCYDCDNPHGVLTLRGYTLGDELTTANFLSFTYSSSVFPSGFTISAPGSIGGSISSVPGANYVYFGDDIHSFYSGTGSGFWNIDYDGVSADYGTAGTWSAAPEPAAWAMMVMGFGLAGAALRRRARVSVSFA